MNNNYNPGCYVNQNPFGNFYNTQGQPQQNPQNFQQQMPVMQQTNYISGKIVDSEDIVKVADIPFGGYGVFPRADLTEIYFKTWNSNGTTSIITYKPVTQQSVQSQEEIINKILQKVENLETKLLGLTQPYPAISTNPANSETGESTQSIKREVNLNDY